jgi:hypothetical protein
MDPIQVSLSRSGGLLPTGNLEITASTAAPDGAQLAEYVEQAGVEQLAARSPMRSRGADMYAYELVVQRGGERYQIEVDGALPEEMRPLVRWLEQRATAERRRKRTE